MYDAHTAGGCVVFICCVACRTSDTSHSHSLSPVTENHPSAPGLNAVNLSHAARPQAAQSTHNPPTTQQLLLYHQPKLHRTLHVLASAME
eukprot:scaffold421_cov125-Isochrysis_galbana.AAC.4